MNQILVTEKLYVTPELKKKRKVYKIEFFLSVLLICLLFSYYIYAEYDRNKSEETSQVLLQNMEMQENVQEDNTRIKLKDNILVVALDENYDSHSEAEKAEEIRLQELREDERKRKEANIVWHIAPNGEEYYTVAVINIPTINVNYPVLQQQSDSLLKIAPNKFWGPEPNEVGNFCIVGHNYRNTKFFSKVPNLEYGDIIELTDLANKTVQYEVYDSYIVEPDDTECTSQLTDGRREITLITCTNDSQKRVIVKAKEVM